MDRVSERLDVSAEQLVVALAGCLALLTVILIAACARPIATVAAQPVNDLRRQSEVIERELDVRGEQELRVRVTNVTRRILQGAQSVDADNAATIQAEVDAINALLSSLKLPPLAPALRFDNGRLVW